MLLGLLVGYLVWSFPLYWDILRRFWLCCCCLTCRHWSTTAVLVASMHWRRLSRLYTGFLSSVLEQMILTFPISCKHLDLGGPQTMTVHTHSPRQTGPHRSPPSSSCCKEKNSQLTLKYSASQNCWFDTARPMQNSPSILRHIEAIWFYLWGCFRHSVGKGQTSLPWWGFLRLTAALWAHALTHTHTQDTHTQSSEQSQDTY